MLRKVVFSCALSLLFVSSGFAITIDDFEGAPQIVTAMSPNATNVSAQPMAGALGGTRELHVQAGSEIPNLIVQLVANAGVLSQSQPFGLSVSSKVVWDGDTDGSAVDYTGLGGVDFLEDGATAIETTVTFDYAFSNSATITITVFDAADPTGNTFSTSSIILSSALVSSPVTFPFASMTDGPSGGADFSNVGAIQLEIEGEPSIDMAITWIGTNGECKNFPLPSGSLYDECGVCNGNNDTCLDCLGVINGPDLPGEMCDTILPGVCKPGQWSDECICKSIKEPGIEICDGLDNDCDSLIDETFPLLGDSCSAGEGECAVEGEYVCDDEGELTCNAEIDYDALEDCGEIIGCDGVPNSGLVPDICGICGGDGTSCDGCEGHDITETLFRLDAGAKHQEALIIRQAKVLKRLWKKTGRLGKKRVAKLDALLEHAHDLQIRNWVLSWTLPQIAVECPDTAVHCVEVSNLTTLNEYRDHATELRKISRRLNRMLKKAGQRAKTRTRQWKRAQSLFDENMALAATVPDFQSECL